MGPGTAPMIRLLHVEDDPAIRRGLTSLLRGAPGMSLVASCGTCAESMSILAGGLDFEVALVDLGLPDGSGVEVIREVRRVRPLACALAFTVFDDATSVFESLKAGACGYLLKDTPPDQLLRAIEEAVAGGAPMTPSIARMVVQSFSTRRASESGDRLTARETEVLQGLSRGESYAGIAAALGVELSTVQGYVKAIYRKLEVNSKAEATAVALSRGLVGG